MQSGGNGTKYLGLFDGYILIMMDQDPAGLEQALFLQGSQMIKPAQGIIDTFETQIGLSVRGLPWYLQIFQSGTIGLFLMLMLCTNGLRQQRQDQTCLDRQLL